MPESTTPPLLLAQRRISPSEASTIASALGVKFSQADLMAEVATLPRKDRMSTQSGVVTLMLALLLLLASCAGLQRPPAEIQRDWCSDVGQEKCR
jgi:hypothetical protein